MSEYKILHENSENIIITFGGMLFDIDGIPPFEFLNYLSKTYTESVDLYFFIDKKQCWYHRGFDGITNNVDDTVIYLNNIINKKKYKNVIFMGVSAGGYASILYGSLCNNVTHVISFIPRTTRSYSMVDPRYYNLKNFINNKTKYYLNGSTEEKVIDGDHNISQCYNLDCYSNVEIIVHKYQKVSFLRDDGTIKSQIDNILYN